jgi:hypothetical protein
MYRASKSLLGHLGAVEQLGHEDKQGDGHQHVVVHQAPAVVGEHVEQAGDVPAVVDQTEQGGDAGKAVGQGQARDNGGDQHHEHGNGHKFVTHRFPSFSAWVYSPGCR